MDSQAPLLLEGPKAKAEATDSAAPTVIDLEPVRDAADDSASGTTGSSETAAPDSRWRLPSYVPLAAVIAFAVAFGAIAGAATTSSLFREPAPDTATAIDATRSLQASVAQLGSELATLKAGIANAQRSASAQFGKLTERLDRSEKALVEPAAKLAKIQDSIDRLDQRQQTAAASEITNSVTPKEDSKPLVAEGWRLRDFYAGRAVVESRNGMLFEVGPGSNLPGLGKVETVKRENGKVTVTTRNGIIAASLESRRPAYPMPYRY